MRGSRCHRVFWIFHTGRAAPPRAECTTTKAGCCPTAKTCATAWMWTVWAASTPAQSVGRASVGSSAAATGSGFMSRWRWKVERLSGTNLLPNYQWLFFLNCWIVTSEDIFPSSLLNSNVNQPVDSYQHVILCKDMSPCSYYLKVVFFMPTRVNKHELRSSNPVFRYLDHC